ncbi:AraC family transcriptional regulator [Spirilliplanes yamanashiensis]|uniref:AraC family transcriptional regulator n=1 Tax=Spirilliplanes yamanashiensis TaxID=42233 RepID=A0A8J3Y7N6_9ACTN|nr:AraC family transcriptional regulator [Spirilliplanes yamanashiensis]MDP9817525.1 AraC-like DNA-binding protein [Spirilliplanes yamanashiensis]GIJ02822.1 AraC family transcriptional regulator [Spirilliplanes yamanashiensis]
MDVTGAAVVRLTTTDLDEAREVCGAHLYPRTLRLTDPAAGFAARFAFLHAGPFTVGDMRYGAEIAGACGELGDYHVNLPLTGSFAAAQAGRPVTGAPGHAGVYRPVGDTVLHRSGADCHFIALRLRRAAVEGQLAAELDRPVRGPIRLSARMDTRAGHGRICAGLIRWFAAGIEEPAGLAQCPAVADPLAEALIAALLLSTGHQFRDALAAVDPATGGAPACPARALTRVADAVRADPARAYTAGELARIAGVGVPTLRHGFRRRFGVGPMSFVWRERLAAARAELLAADAPVDLADGLVAAVARRWGFGHPARFAARYRSRYGVGPRDTLRGEG